MRVCPKCGYIDPPEWRHLRWSYWIDFCTREDFSRLQPNIMARLLNGEKLAKDKAEIYIYRLSGSNNIHRKALIDYGEQFSIPMEHHQYRTIPHDLRKYWVFDASQSKLVDWNGKQK